MIETDRLILKNWQVDDASALFRLASDPLVGPACGWQPHRDVEESRDLIANGPLSAAESYAIRLKATGELMGSISLKPATEHFDVAAEKDLEVGYWLASAYWGCGYASEALRALVARAFCDLDCPALWCGFFDGNDRSKHCMEKCGFAYVKTFSAFERPSLGDTALAYYYRLDAADYLAGGQVKRYEYDAVLTDEAEGGYSCKVPALPGCFTCGDSHDDAVAMATDAARTWVASALKHGEPVPAYRPEEAAAGEVVHIAFDSDPSWIADDAVSS